VVPLQVSPDVHETRTDESDPNQSKSIWAPTRPLLLKGAEVNCLVTQSSLKSTKSILGIPSIPINSDALAQDARIR